MKNIFLLFLVLISLQTYSQTNYIKYVDPFIGTGGHGHTFPGATVPFGMVQLSPDTRIDGSWDGCGGYHYNDSLLYGFSHTHLSGTGVSDYGDILLFPFSGKFDSGNKYSTRFDHKDESASVGYYSVLLKNQDIKVELTTSERVGFHQYTYKKNSDSAMLMIDLRHRDNVIEAELFQVDEKHLAGFRRSSGWARDQLIFFYVEFSENISIDTILSDSTKIDAKNKLEIYAGSIIASIKLKLNQEKEIKIKVALSSVSVEGAENNMHKEIPGWDFNEVRKNAELKWNKELSKIEVKGGTDEQYKIFYTSLYHCMIAPNIYNDVDGNYRGRDFKIHKTQSDHYTVFSLWDTFRAWHPLMTIIDQKRTLDYIKTFLRQYERGRLLPVWELSSNETECMIGYHSVSVITDAYMKGIKDFNTEEVLIAMRKSAEAKDRYGLGAYMDHGYIDVLDESESVSKTLEYSYDDWCISEFAKAIGRGDVAKQYLKRSNHWKNLFDNDSKFIRPKKNGGWLTPFDPSEVNNNYTEANAWQYTFFVPQDIDGVICKMGGRENFEKKLDELFSANDKTTGRDQADITGLIGQYAQGNEPSHHMAYLYNYTDHPWKTQMYVTKILNEMYHASPDGLIGNEDCGQMSAWYVISAIGLYQVCPGKSIYDLTTPLFNDVLIHLENGNTLHIKKENANIENAFIQNITYNAKQCSKQFSHSSLLKGGEIVFKMGNEKLTEKLESPKGKMKERLMSGNTCYSDFISSPVINFNSSVFKNFAEVSMSSDSGLEIYYTLDGQNPTLNSFCYTNPLHVDSSLTLKAIAVNNYSKISYCTTSKFYKMPHPEWEINIKSKYNRQYTAGGDEGIIDGLSGDENWRKGGWQGFQGQDFEATIDFGKEINISSLSSEYLQDTRSWILMPVTVDYELSIDGIKFENVLTIQNTLPDTLMTPTIREFGGNIKSTKARYLKVKAKNYGDLPSGHAGKGGDAFIFIDEIVVK